MSIINSLSLLARSKTPRRGRAVAGRMLQVETLESRLTLSAVPTTDALDLVEDAASAVDQATAAVVADARGTDGASDGVSETLAIRVVDATPASALESSRVVLLAEADAVLSARAAADALLACQPVAWAATGDARLALSATRDLRAELRNAWTESRPDRQHRAWAPILGPLPVEFVGPLLDRPALSRASLNEAAPTQLVPTVLTASSQVAGYSTEYEGGGEEQVSSAPVITSFRATMGVGNVLILEGEVHYQDPSILVVIFGGLPEWRGTNPEPDGSFSYAMIVPPGFHSIISAQAFSPMEEVSNVAYAWI